MAQVPQIEKGEEGPCREDERIGAPCIGEVSAEKRERGVVQSASKAVDAKEAAPEAQHGRARLEEESEQEDRGQRDPSRQSKEPSCSG